MIPPDDLAIDMRTIPDAMPRLTRCVLALALTVGLTTGCSRSGSGVERVRGRITCGGQPVPTGMVTFVAKGSGLRHSSSIRPDGTYELEARAGDYAVAVIAVEELPTGPVTPQNWRESFAAAGVRRNVPEVFGDPETSQLTCTVGADQDNTCDIAIPAAEPRPRSGR
jgi:hypothetical protein